MSERIPLGGYSLRACFCLPRIRVSQAFFLGDFVRNGAAASGLGIGSEWLPQGEDEEAGLSGPEIGDFEAANGAKTCARRGLE